MILSIEYHDGRAAYDLHQAQVIISDDTTPEKLEELEEYLRDESPRDEMGIYNALDDFGLNYVGIKADYIMTIR